MAMSARVTNIGGRIVGEKQIDLVQRWRLRAVATVTRTNNHTLEGTEFYQCIVDREVVMLGVASGIGEAFAQFRCEPRRMSVIVRDGFAGVSINTTFSRSVEAMAASRAPIDAGVSTFRKLTFGVPFATWPDRADGNGSSLEVIDTAGNYNDPRNWRSSTEYAGESTCSA